MARAHDFYDRGRARIDDRARRGSAKFGSRVTGWLLLVPDLLALYVRLLLDRRVSKSAKGVLAGAALYAVSPIDLVPEFLIGPLGLIDDLAVLCFALQRAKEAVGGGGTLIGLWSGDPEIGVLVDRTVDVVGSFFDRQVVLRLTRRASE